MKQKNKVFRCAGWDFIQRAVLGEGPTETTITQEEVPADFNRLAFTFSEIRRDTKAELLEDVNTYADGRWQRGPLFEFNEDKTAIRLIDDQKK